MNCPFCNSPVDPNAFFCPNCGKKLREKPLSTGIWTQVGVYVLSLVLPPLNLPFTIRYLKSAEPKAKSIGWISLGLMLVSIIVALWLSIGIFKNLNQQVNKSMQMYNGLLF